MSEEGTTELKREPPVRQRKWIESQACVRKSLQMPMNTIGHVKEAGELVRK